MNHLFSLVLFYIGFIFMMIRIIFCTLFFPVILFAQTINEDPMPQMSDPIEPVNRLIWDFNYKILDAYIYRPVTQNYVDLVPTPGRKAINNFALNFEEPSTFVNNLIQLNFKHSAKSFFRFSINSTFGILGFLDVAKKLGVERQRESFSDVLGHWSVPNGPYLMLPVLGPRSTRKLLGSVVDNLYFPFSSITLWESAGILGLDGLDKRESLLGQEPLLDLSLDPYLFVKESYIQYEIFRFYANQDAHLSLQKKQKENLEMEFDDTDLDKFMDEIE